MGYILWSDDNETLYHTGLELHMNDLRGFIRVQVELLQSQLEDLLLHLDENRRTAVSTFQARDLRDNAAHTSDQWNFLRDLRNQKA